MKKIIIEGRTWKIEDETFEKILEKYEEFYKNVNTCSRQCPMGNKLGLHSFILKDEFNDLYGQLMAYDCCFCDLFIELRSYCKNDKCPCFQWKDKAFVRLEKALKRNKVLK